MDNTLVHEFLQRTQNTKSENTFTTYSYHMKYWFPTEVVDLSPAFIDNKIGSWRKANTSMTTIVNRLRTLQQFLNFLRDKELTIPCYRELQAIIHSVEPQDKIPVIATVEQVEQALQEIKDLKYKAIISLLFFGGLRVSEVTHLDSSDYNATKGEILVRDPKNRRERIVRLEDSTIVYLDKYIAQERIHSCEALFTTTHGRACTNTVQRQVTKYSGLNPHAFRHGSATYLLEQGIDLRLIQDFLGHKSITTTQRYTHITNARKDDIRNAFAKR